MFRVVPTLAAVPKAPWNSAPSAVAGLEPMAAMMIAPITKASRMDSRGTTKPVSDFRNFSIAAPLFTRHGQTDLLNGRVLSGELSHDLALEHN